MRIKSLCAFTLSFILLLYSTMVASAHSVSQEGILAKSYIGPPYNGYYIGGEDVGWSIDEGYHTNGTTLTYSFSSNDPNLTYTYKSYVTSGARKWSGTVAITNKTDGSGTGLIKTYNSPNSSTIAQFTDYSANSSGHLKSWVIEMNRSKTQSATVLAHELGHAIGLNDLYASKSSDKLMYGYSSTTATSPTSSDKWGAKVITGAHTSHTWGYNYHSTNSAGNIHIKYCTDCNGSSLIIEQCTYNSQRICTKCKIPYGVQPYSTSDEMDSALKLLRGN